MDLIESALFSIPQRGVTIRKRTVAIKVSLVCPVYLIFRKFYNIASATIARFIKETPRIEGRLKKQFNPAQITSHS